MTRRKDSPDPETTYAAITSFASDTPVVGTIVKRGQLMPGSSAVVRAHLGMFRPAGERLPSEDAMAAARPIHEAHDPWEPRVLKPLRPEDTLICIREVQSGAVWIPVGSRIDRRHFAVQAFPERFRVLTTEET